MPSGGFALQARRFNFADGILSFSEKELAYPKSAVDDKFNVKTPWVFRMNTDCVICQVFRAKSETDRGGIGCQRLIFDGSNLSYGPFMAFYQGRAPVYDAGLSITPSTGVILACFLILGQRRRCVTAAMSPKSPVISTLKIDAFEERGLSSLIVDDVNAFVVAYEADMTRYIALGMPFGMRPLVPPP